MKSDFDKEWDNPEKIANTYADYLKHCPNVDISFAKRSLIAAIDKLCQLTLKQQSTKYLEEIESWKQTLRNVLDMPSTKMLVRGEVCYQVAIPEAYMKRLRKALQPKKGITE